ncbi:serine/threonine-protein kinase RIO1-like [Ornithodoros turicata]|uniref:serine/threonine-protein kinase RIO1-like n=1 Tax=Ornithodoros turicata TaxID=34597 RepID=UPI00313A1478
MIDDVVEGQFDDADDVTEIGDRVSRTHLGADTLAAGDHYSSEDDFVSSGSDDELYEWGLTQKGIIMAPKASAAHPNAQSGSKNIMKFQSSSKVLSGKFSGKINLNHYEGPPVSNSAVNVLNEAGRKYDSDRVRVRDKVERATVEQVLDRNTRIVLFKMLNRGVFKEINGCISTGKEANVYHATTEEGLHRAIKVYKTSILVFKDRDRYVSGEFRFRNGYCSSNPRKMVRTWAEKEMRNLSRIHSAGVTCPKPVTLRSHVLVMEFVGKDGWPSPKLKDVELSESKARELYLDCILMMRRLYHDCRLVHADLSEYNLLYHEGKVVTIDVSQSVEHDHPNALEFLRKDCTNITDFFAKCGVKTMTMRQLFDFVTDPNINDGNIDAYLERAQELVDQQEDEMRHNVDEEVFKKSYIPQRLDQVLDFEKDIVEVQERNKEILYHTITGMKADLSGPAQKPALLGEVSSESDGSGESEDDDDDVEKEGSKFRNMARPREETLEEKKERKKAVKEAKKEKRQSKIPKHVKKKKEKQGKMRKK